MRDKFSLTLLSACILALGIIYLIKNPLITPLEKKEHHIRQEQMVADHPLNLVDPELAPENIRPLAMEGYHILLETKKYAPKYAGDTINCTNCHFSAGNTLGETNGGISLVGTPKYFPKHLPNNKLYTLKERINSCFEKSINGTPLPEDSREMAAIISYLEWITQPVAELKTIPWHGLKKLHSEHRPDPVNGKKLYSLNCAVCHGKQGQGQPRQENLSYPPLWGDHAFNSAAGMNQPETFAAFIYYNMPYTDPGLTEEEALDIAAFVTKQPRPILKGKFQQM